MSMPPIARLLTRKGAPGETRLDVVDASPPLADGEALLALDRFSLTTNNITYAHFGEAMNYWDFFPTGVDGWGQMPVWGFANVVDSRAPGVEVGERFYGYFPIASHLRVTATQVSPRGFTDGAANRQPLPGVYNQYPRCSADPAYEPALEDCQALFRPLFLTAFALADFLKDHGFFGARRAVLSSASSKTAYGTAFCLADAGLELVGLTSPSNRAFVDGMGAYDRVVDYGAAAELGSDQPTLYIDFSGDVALRATLHHALGDALAYDCVVGATNNTSFAAPADLPGPKPTFFFAPTQLARQEEKGGLRAFMQAFAQTQSAFFARAQAGWIDIVEGQGFDGAASVIADLAAGRSDPRAGHIIRL